MKINQIIAYLFGLFKRSRLWLIGFNCSFVLFGAFCREAKEIENGKVYSNDRTFKALLSIGDADESIESNSNEVSLTPCLANTGFFVTVFLLERRQ